MDKEIRSIQLDLDKLLLNIDNVVDNQNIDNMERDLQELNENYESIDNRVSRLKEDLEERRKERKEGRKERRKERTTRE